MNYIGLFLATLFLCTTTALAGVAEIQPQNSYNAGNSASYNEKLAMMTTSGNVNLADEMQKYERQKLEMQRQQLENQRLQLEIEKQRRANQGGEVVQCRKMCDGQGNCRTFCPE